MRRTALLAVFLALAGCGLKTIQKQPVPRADEIAAIQLLSEGDQLLRENKAHLALLKFVEASQLDPYSEHIFNMLAITYLRLHRFDQAERAAERAVGLNRQYASAFNALGVARFAQADLGDAARYIQRAIRLDDDVPNYYLNLGEVFFRQGKIQEAREAFREALSKDASMAEQASLLELPSQSEIHPEEYYQRAHMWADFGQAGLCIDYLSRAISAGFDDFQRILEEPSFQRFRENEAFQRFLRRTGIARN